MKGLVDAAGRPIQLGDKLGEGGEGGVFEVAGAAKAAVKVYHDAHLDDDQVAKLEAMVSLSSDALTSISAWPWALIYEAQTRRPCGIVLPKVADARHLHELYGTLSRRRHFPGAAWHHMVLAARNTAAAFHTVQATGVVIGDVNQGNLMVDAEMRVRLIDCDSFQICSGERKFTCPVGTPHFTPPELQSLQLRDIERTINHDGFGLAVLIFHLLFMGRHPFAGRYLGSGDMTIEKAIAERRFAFSRKKSETLVDPPPASLLLEDLPPSTGELFERAFRADGANGQPRPTPMEWVQDLEQLIKVRKACSFDPMHVYYQNLRECPWCRIEDFGGPTFFVPHGDTSTISKSRLAEMNKRVRALSLPLFPDLAPAQIAQPSMPVMKKLKRSPPLSIPDLISYAMVLSIIACLCGPLSPWALAGGTAGALLSGLLLLFEKDSKGRRKRLNDFQTWLEQGKKQIADTGQEIMDRHNKNAADFNRSSEDVMQSIRDYHAEGKALVRVLVEQSDAKRGELLRNFVLRENMPKIKGLKPSHVSILESYGVESAYEVEKVSLYGIPMISSTLVLELLSWREEIERGMVLKPDHGVTPAEMEIATEAATQRYKVAQARRVLTSANRLESVAASAQSALDRELQEYDELCGRWREMGGQMRDFQSQRRPLERKLNSSPEAIVGAMLGGPVLGGLVWFLSGL